MKGTHRSIVTGELPGSVGVAKLELLDEPTGEGEIPRVVQVLSVVLERLVSCSERQAATGEVEQPPSGKLASFHGLRPPAIPVSKYLERIHKYAGCSPACFLAAYVYVDRLAQRCPDLRVTPLNVHRLAITCVMCAAKFLDDAYFNNAYFARIGGVTTAEINRLEIALLSLLDFRLHVPTDMLAVYAGTLEASAGLPPPVPKLPPATPPLSYNGPPISAWQPAAEEQPAAVAPPKVPPTPQTTQTTQMQMQQPAMAAPQPPQVPQPQVPQPVIRSWAQVVQAV